MKEINRYYNNDELESLLDSLQKNYPQLVEIKELGKSFEQRPIFLVVLSDKTAGIPDQKPAVWIDANLHASELCGSTAALSVIYKLCRNFAVDQEIRRLLRCSTLYIVARANPDGVERIMADVPIFIRGSVNSSHADPSQPKLEAQDIDRDGRILQMRIVDKHGDWKISKSNPRVMIPRQANDNGGKYYRVVSEGLIENYDGTTIPEMSYGAGIDFNRNFPYGWRPESEQNGAGEIPIAEPEIAAIVNFLLEHKNICLALSLHSYSGVILRPFSNAPDSEFNREDLAVYQQLGDLAASLSSYPCLSMYQNFRYEGEKGSSGVFHDWVYHHLGIFGFTAELWNLPAKAGIDAPNILDWFRKHSPLDDLTIVGWLEQNTEVDAYVEWRPFCHPQLGEVEIGGWDHLNSWRNPPLEVLPEELEKIYSLVTGLSATLPLLEIKSVTAIKIEEEIFRIEAVVENAGYLSSSVSVQARNRAPQDSICISLELENDLKVISGENFTRMDHLEGRSASRPNLYYHQSTSSNRKAVSWTLFGSANSAFTIRVNSSRAGCCSQHCVIAEILREGALK